MTNAFVVLGVGRDATAQEIRLAYRARARELHPDRHVRPDGTVPRDAHEAFCELGVALRTALASRARVPAGVQVPAQRVADPGSSPVPRQRAARAQPRRRPLREVDPMVAFLTLPQRCSPEWPAEALATWALTLGPAARPHVGEGRRRAVAAGATGQQPLVAATCHAMLSLTLGGRRGRLPGLDEGRLATAYAVLESSLPRAVVAALPPRVSSADRAMRRLGWLSVPLGAGAVLALGQGGELLTELFG